MKTLMLAIILSATAVPVLAQTGYYDRSRTIEIGDGATYKCDNDGTLVTLYNSENTYTYRDMTYMGGPVPPKIGLPSHSTVELTEFGDNCIRSIVNGAFSARQKELLKGELFTVTLIIDPGYEVARLIELNFDFFASSPLAKIPPAVFRNIEVNMKSQWAELSHTVEPFAYVTETGRKLNYVMLSWQHEVK